MPQACKRALAAAPSLRPRCLHGPAGTGRFLALGRADPKIGQPGIISEWPATGLHKRWTTAFRAVRCVFQVLKTSPKVMSGSYTARPAKLSSDGFIASPGISGRRYERCAREPLR